MVTHGIQCLKISHLIVQPQGLGWTFQELEWGYEIHELSMTSLFKLPTEAKGQVIPRQFVLPGKECRDVNNKTMHPAKVKLLYIAVYVHLSTYISIFTI